MLDGPAFAAEVEGWTVEFTLRGAFFGRERYLPDGEVLWQTADGQCLRGRWLPAADLICFSYEDDPDDVRCWQVTREPEGVSARVPGTPEDEVLRESGRHRAPLNCPGPALGV
ncbi:MAG: hypothetical protein VYD87_15265 [Pseudomonadota bacterium]|nr:hypothetical protein [Pseudomonadota bacterium]